MHSEVGRHQGMSKSKVSITSCLLKWLHLIYFWRQHGCQDDSVFDIPQSCAFNSETPELKNKNRVRKLWLVVSLCVNVCFDQISIEVIKYLLSSPNHQRSLFCCRSINHSAASEVCPKLILWGTYHAVKHQVSCLSFRTQPQSLSSLVWVVMRTSMAHSEWALEGVDVTMCTNIT